MFENDKLAEAEHFLRELETCDHSAVRHNLSAFLTAARSVLQYAREEARTKAGGQAWHDQEVKRDAVVAFLRDKRDLNVHERPVPMKTEADVNLSSTVTASATLSMVVIDGRTGERREILPDESNPSGPMRERTIPKISVTFRYEFCDWPGSEDVPTLCARYLTEVRRIVHDGRAQGLLTP